MDTRSFVVIPEAVDTHVPGADIIEKDGRYSVRGADGHFYFLRAKVRKVKNLGWLLRNWKNVDRFTIRSDGLMIAHLRSGGYYRTMWADLTVCREWLKRPVFAGVTIDWTT